jgi:hypothetical protein
MSHAIVTAARSWLGTRFHHQGRVKCTNQHAGGVDCLGLLMGVAQELHLTNAQGIALASCDETYYPHQPDCQKLYMTLSQHLIQIPIGDITPGNILLLKVDQNPQHLAIVSDYQNGFGMIHAYAPARAVVEHALDTWWKNAIAAAFRI